MYRRNAGPRNCGVKVIEPVVRESRCHTASCGEVILVDHQVDESNHAMILFGCVMFCNAHIQSGVTSLFALETGTLPFRGPVFMAKWQVTRAASLDCNISWKCQVDTVHQNPYLSISGLCAWVKTHTPRELRPSFQPLSLEWPSGLCSTWPAPRH